LIRIVCCELAELPQERLSVGSASTSSDERLFKSVAVLMTARTVTGLTEIFELLVVTVPAITLLVVFSRSIAVDRLATGDTGHLLVGVSPP
jgi:hypothetical protein